MKRIINTILISIVAFAMNAQTVVVDRNGEPVIGAMAFDHDEHPICIVDAQGLMPNVNINLYPITLRCMGFENTKVVSPADSIVMNEAANELAEVVVNRKERPNMYVVCYVKEVSTVTDSIDSICWKGQFMADFMLPAFKGAKCKSWEKPRELTREVECYFNNPDIEEEKSDMASLFFYSIYNPFDKENKEVPDSLKGKAEGSYSVNKKSGVEKMYRLSPNNYTVTIDNLAGFKDHKFSMPFFFKWAGLSMDFLEMWSQHTFTHNDVGNYSALNMNAAAYSLKVYCDGKKFKKFFPSGNPIYIYSYIEFYPVEICFLTKEEAQEIKKNKPERTLEVPSFR